MGFAASSARLYMLLARKMDLEFQLQQINQARLRLTNVLDKLYAGAQSLEPENPAVVLQEQFMERIQNQDKRLELISNRIQLQHQAITTEVEGLRKIISKSIESTFKLQA
jgi:hypothetical protein